uniref:Uncharacterized protein n=1 Tax=Anguilla anguilla TaxID=7936 RepID=A0A0E9Q3F3_ANGAN
MAAFFWCVILYAIMVV